MADESWLCSKGGRKGVGIIVCHCPTWDEGEKKEQEDVWGLLKESSSKTFCHQNFPGRSQSVLSFPCLQLGKRNNTALLKSVGTGECLAFDLKWSSMALKYSGHAVNLFGGGKNYGSHSEKRWQKEQTL